MVYAPRQSQLMLMQKLTTKRLDYYVGITVQERLFGPNAENKLTEDNSDQIEIHPEFNCASSPWPCVRDQNVFKNFGRKHTNAPSIAICANFISLFLMSLAITIFSTYWLASTNALYSFFGMIVLTDSFMALCNCADSLLTVSDNVTYSVKIDFLQQNNDNGGSGTINANPSPLSIELSK